VENVEEFGTVFVTYVLRLGSIVPVTGYRIALEQRHYAPATINLRLAAVRRLAYEAADCGLLSADLAAGIRRVKGAGRLGIRIGNWLTAEEGKRPIGAFGSSNVRHLRRHASPPEYCFERSTRDGLAETASLPR